MKNKWFCIGQSGSTIDGREIDENVLIEMAESYNPATYGARINIEHIRPFMPGSDLGGYGDVLELKAKKENGKTKLYARLDPTEKMLNLLKNREKVFTSMEIIKEFADTKKAYLVGLALTDSPASTGTDMLKFSMQQAPGSLVSQHVEMKEITMEKTEKDQKKAGMFAALMASLFSQKQEEEQPQEPEKLSIEERVEAGEEELKAAYAVIEKIGEAYAEQDARLADIEQKFAVLESTPVNGKTAHVGGITGKQKSEF